MEESTVQNIYLVLLFSGFLPVPFIIMVVQIITVMGKKKIEN